MFYMKSDNVETRSNIEPLRSTGISGPCEMGRVTVVTFASAILLLAINPFTLDSKIIIINMIDLLSKS